MAFLASLDERQVQTHFQFLCNHFKGTSKNSDLFQLPCYLKKYYLHTTRLQWDEP